VVEVELPDAPAPLVGDVLAWGQRRLHALEEAAALGRASEDGAATLAEDAAARQAAVADVLDGAEEPVAALGRFALFGLTRRAGQRGGCGEHGTEQQQKTHGGQRSSGGVNVRLASRSGFKGE